MGTGRAWTRGGRWAADAVVATTVVAALAAVVARVVGRSVDVATVLPEVATAQIAVDVGSAVLFAVPGWYLVRHRPDIALGWLALAAGAGHAVAAVGVEWALAATVRDVDLPAPWVGAWLANWGSLVELPVLAAAYSTFPDGPPASRGLRAAGRVAIGLTAAGVGVLVLDPTPFGAPGTDADLAGLEVPFGLDALDPIADGDVALFGVGMLLAIGVLAVRWRRAEGEVRRVLGVLVAVAVPGLLSPGLVLAFGASGAVIVQALTLVTVAVLVAGVLRHRLYGIEVVVRRALLYGVLTAIVVGVHALAIGLAGIVGGDDGTTGSLVAALAAALVLLPARTRVERGVDHLLYGERDDPFVVVTRVADRLEGAGSTAQVLPRLVSSTAQALKVPYVGITLARADGPLCFAHGERREASVESVPIVHRGRDLGVMEVARRPGEDGFGAAELRLLADLASRASAAAAQLVLEDELRRSRERIVVAREEERRRLRNDLHDGLGPQLTGVALGLDAVADTLDDPARAARVHTVGDEVRDAIADVRRIVHDLRPPRLDEVGLAGALRESAGRAARGGLDVVVDIAEPPRDLPAAVEVAVYRVAAEALTNVVRHSGARTCTVRLEVEPAVVRLVVQDDGCGLPEGANGVGTTSMHDRADELGGRLTLVTDAEGRGCTVALDLPLAEAAATADEWPAPA